MQTNAPNMSKGAQVALAAVIGGTAEALGGGKPARLCRNNALANARIIRRGGVANGAVTGAYVMMLNHLAYQGDGGDPQKGNEKQKLSLKDKELVGKLIEEMKKINDKEFEGGNIKDLFDKESVTFENNLRWKTVELVFDGSIVLITIVNPKFGPDFGFYYRIEAYSFQTFGRAKFAAFDLKGNHASVNLRFYNEKVFNKVYDYVFSTY